MKAVCPIRPARPEDLSRIAEIEVFNYRLNFYPIFRNDDYYFDELGVPAKMDAYRDHLNRFYVYDDGAVKGFCCVQGDELKKLFVEPALQGRTIGAQLLAYAVDRLHVRWLWALEKNVRAIAFYERHGFSLTADKEPEEDTDEYLVRMERRAKA